MSQSGASGVVVAKGEGDPEDASGRRAKGTNGRSWCGRPLSRADEGANV